MNTQERDMLNAFLTQLTQAQAGAKEPEAQTLIAQALAKQPDAGYLLVQRAMQLDFVLQQSQARVAELQAQLERQQPAPQTSFLNDVHAWGRGPSATTSGLGAGAAAAAVGSSGRRASCQRSACCSARCGHHTLGFEHDGHSGHDRSRGGCRVVFIFRHPKPDG